MKFNWAIAVSGRIYLRGQTKREANRLKKTLIGQVHNVEIVQVQS